MQLNKENNKSRIYIDGANLHSALKSSGYSIDYNKFFVWLSEEFRTNYIFLFLGFIESYKNFYKQLESIGYKLIFKETLSGSGKIKGNCDAELVLKATTDIIEGDLDNIILVSSDGDFACLLKFAIKRGKYVRVLSPSHKLSYLIRKMNIDITWLEEMAHNWEKNNKT